MKTQVTTKNTETTPDLEARLASLQAKVESKIPAARFAKYVLEAAPTVHAVGVVVAMADGDTWVRHGEGEDWERAFLELERRLDRFEETE
ncbi:MAG: hypothetical protein ACR2GQ_03135 [Gemmatimonadota bacterium]|jgi:hypothetical protein